MASTDDEWYYERRRIPITKGWGPCKKTHWVPVNEYYTGRNPRTVRTFLRAVGLNPDATFETRAAPTQQVVYLDNDDNAPVRYDGFREREIEAGPWRYYPGRGRPPIPRDDLDPAIAQDLRELEEMRQKRHRDNIDRINQQMDEINNRLANNFREFGQAMQGRGPERELQEAREELDRHREIEELRMRDNRDRELEHLRLERIERLDRMEELHRRMVDEQRRRERRHYRPRRPRLWL
ncbi:hypothetical protein LTR06_004756 [Exophiala xenobiotica]|nr:hypothetical protein LTR06_004756 [Exophiala xenobiotica]